LYHRRNLVETVFSVLKRMFGESMKARKFQSQIKELKIKLILYNISKIILAIFIRNYHWGFTMKDPRLFIMFAWVHDSCAFLQSHNIVLFYPISRSFAAIWFHNRKSRQIFL
jgi:hypothetical protein